VRVGGWGLGRGIGRTPGVAAPPAAERDIPLGLRQRAGITVHDRRLCQDGRAGCGGCGSPAQGPPEVEQGIFSAEQGIVSAEQGSGAND
jgi:hypothetical protein